MNTMKKHNVRISYQNINVMETAKNVNVLLSWDHLHFSNIYIGL